jgi:hypothetical protein
VEIAALAKMAISAGSAGMASQFRKCFAQNRTAFSRYVG